MEAVAFSKTNRLIRKSIVRTFPACFASTLMGAVILMVDSLLAGAFISPLAIAAVAIGNPITSVFRSLNQTIGNGAAVCLTISVGRGNKEDSSRVHSLGLIGSSVMGLFFTLFALIFADALVLPFGGAGNPELARQAALYLRSCALMILGQSINIYFGKMLALYGYQKELFFISFVGVLANTSTSILLVWLLPAELAIAGLGIGTCIGSALGVTINLILLRVKHIPLKFRFYRFTMREIFGAVKLGFPTASNDLIDGLIAGVINNLILAGFGGDTNALAIYTAVKGVFGFATAPALSTTLSTAPLFGLLYGARDKNGIRRTLDEGFKVGLVFNLMWCGVLIALLPTLMGFFGMAGSPIVRNGVYIMFLFIPVILALRMMTTLFECTERPAMGLAYSIIPDSVIYPLMLMLMIPYLGYNAIWISYGANGIVFLVLIYLAHSLSDRKTKMSFERMLCLDESVRNNVPMMDISINAGTQTANELPAKVHGFMRQSGASERTAYMAALCIEEIMSDFLTRTTKQTLNDIKLFDDKEYVRIILRNAAAPYNPLDFDANDPAKIGVKATQQVAKRIEYAYVYKLNVITIDLEK